MRADEYSLFTGVRAERSSGAWAESSSSVFESVSTDSLPGVAMVLQSSSKLTKSNNKHLRLILIMMLMVLVLMLFLVVLIIMLIMMLLVVLMLGLVLMMMHKLMSTA